MNHRNQFIRLVRRSLALVLALICLCLLACESYKPIPSGFVGKVLRPTGFEDKIYEAGQVELGTTAENGQASSLVLLEATTVTVKEQFMRQADGGADREDHRVLTRQRVPISVDIYVQIAIPEEKKDRDAIFAQVTAKAQGKPEDRTSVILLQDVYNAFVRQTIRGKTREIFMNYEDDREINAHLEKVNKEIASMVADIFKSNHVPLRLINVQLSNIKVDDAVWGAEAKQMAAGSEVEQIRLIGQAIHDNPSFVEYLKWTSLKEIAATSGKNGNTTIIVVDGASDIGKQLAAAERSKDKTAPAAAPASAASATPPSAAK